MNLAHDSICAAAPVVVAVAVAVAVPVAVPVEAAVPVVPRRRSLGECVLAACDRDPDAAEVVANRLRPRLLEHIEKALGDRAQDAEDVVDAFFLEMLDGGITIAEVGAPVKCLMRVARNFARRHVRELPGHWEVES